MKKMRKFMILYFLIILIFVLAQNNLYADTTVTIPVPDNVTNESKNLVLTITVPTSLERTQQPVTQKPDEKPKKKNYDKYFDLNPFPNMVNKEELDILKKFVNKGITDDVTTSVVKRSFISNNYEMAKALSVIVKIALNTPPELLAKAGVTRGDILDLLKVFDNYTKELKMFNISVKDRELLSKLSNKLSFTDGEIKVIKVETNDMGSTVIHLTINDPKGKYKPQYVSKLEPLPPASDEKQQPTTKQTTPNKDDSNTNINPDNLDFTTFSNSNTTSQQQDNSSNTSTNQNNNNNNITPPDLPTPPEPDLPPPPTE